MRAVSKAGMTMFKNGVLSNDINNNGDNNNNINDNNQAFQLIALARYLLCVPKP